MPRVRLLLIQLCSKFLTPDHDVPEPKAVSYLLSGDPKRATKYLFLSPDGSGSATSHVIHPPVGPDTVMFALNCPFMTTPSQWTNGITTVTKIYLKEIYRSQPNEPYNFGEWSADGILAYEVAARVLQNDGVADRLILIDAPCPLHLPPMPIKIFKFLDSIGLLESGNSARTPKWVIPHFDATVRNLETYTLIPLPQGRQPIAAAIWAIRGVTSISGGKRPVKEPRVPQIVEWMLDDRSDFTSNGWNSLIGGGRLDTK